jgi:hypothetical protein
MTTARMERAVRRTAAASLASYRQAVRQHHDGADWAAVATGLAQSVDLLLGLLGEDDSVAFEMIGELSARTNRNSRQLDALLAVFQAAGAEMPGPETTRPQLTVLPGGSVSPRQPVHR